MKIVFFGTPQIARPFLEILQRDEDIEVVAVVTNPDRPFGRKQEIQMPPVKELANEYDLKVLQPEKIDSDFAELLKKYEADFNVVIAYGQMLPEEILNAPKHGSVNIHFSLLPMYRGASPVQAALLNGDKETGISVMEMSKKLDAGGIYLIKKVGIEENDTSETLLDKLSQFGAILLPSALKDIADGVLTPIFQDESKVSFCKKIKKEHAQVDPTKDTADQIYNKFRAFDPWPGIFMMFNDKRCKLIKISKSDKGSTAGKFEQVDSKLILGTKGGSLKIDELQLEGKKPMKATDFINGFL